MIEISLHGEHSRKQQNIYTSNTNSYATLAFIESHSHYTIVAIV